MHESDANLQLGSPASLCFLSCSCLCTFSCLFLWDWQVFRVVRHLASHVSSSCLLPLTGSNYIRFGPGFSWQPQRADNQKAERVSEKKKDGKQGRYCLRRHKSGSIQKWGKQEWSARQECRGRKPYTKGEKQKRLHISDSWQVFLLLFHLYPLLLVFPSWLCEFCIHHCSLRPTCRMKKKCPLPTRSCNQLFPTIFSCHTAGLSRPLFNSNMEMERL